MPCEAENPNVPVVLGLAYDPDMHSCNWPDLLIDRGCDPSERLGGFKCPSLRGQLTFLWKQIVIKTFLDIEGTFNERFSPFPRFAGNVFICSIDSWIIKWCFQWVILECTSSVLMVSLDSSHVELMINLTRRISPVLGDLHLCFTTENKLILVLITSFTKGRRATKNIKRSKRSLSSVGDKSY